MRLSYCSNNCKRIIKNIDKQNNLGSMYRSIPDRKEGRRMLDESLDKLILQRFLFLCTKEHERHV